MLVFNWSIKGENCLLPELYYGGEALTTLELPQSYTCPYCSRMGFTDVTLQEHVTTDHQDTNFEVVSTVVYLLRLSVLLNIFLYLVQLFIKVLIY